MPRRLVSIVPGEMYHIYNKSVGGERLFLERINIESGLSRLNYYRFQRKKRYSRLEEIKILNSSIDSVSQRLIIQIFAYALMPNHFHFVVKEVEINGIRKFISKFQNSYARYYNIKYQREGVLFQGRFKIKHIINIEQFLHVIRYVHLNPVTAHMFEFSKLSGSERTSYKEYLNLQENKITDTEFILKQFSNIKSFIDFHKNQVDYQRKLASIKKILLD